MIYVIKDGATETIITTHPEPTNPVSEHTQVTFTCAADANPAPTIFLGTNNAANREIQHSRQALSIETTITLTKVHNMVLFHCGAERGFNNNVIFSLNEVFHVICKCSYKYRPILSFQTY